MWVVIITVESQFLKPPRERENGSINQEFKNRR